MIREAMLREYCAMARKARKQIYSTLIRQITDTVEARFSEHLTLRQIAEEISLSPNYLSLRLRKETGKSFSEYLTSVRMDCARRLPADTDLPIAAVAEECGIPDNNYFARLFRKEEKVTPREYRQLNRNR